MEIFKEIGPLRAFLEDKKKSNKSIGLVPTMGALHDGHSSLLKTSILENDITVCSIFVNPAQFNNKHDLAKYPRTLPLDVEKLEKVGCDVLFCPTDTEMYPVPSTVSFNFGHLEDVMEGKYRPGHFSGVALVVSKLLNIVAPTTAYFGQKDWQQFAVIKHLVSELNFSIILKSVPTTRESNGLAMSSRNKRLDKDQRAKSTIFYEALKFSESALKNGSNIQQVKEEVANRFKKDNDVRLEYFELADSENLKSITSVEKADHPILCIAGYVGDIRLIDNMFIDLSLD